MTLLGGDEKCSGSILFGQIHRSTASEECPAYAGVALQRGDQQRRPLRAPPCDRGQVRTRAVGNQDLANLRMPRGGRLQQRRPALAPVRHILVAQPVSEQHLRLLQAHPLFPDAATDVLNLVSRPALERVIRLPSARNLGDQQSAADGESDDPSIMGIWRRRGEEQEFRGVRVARGGSSVQRLEAAVVLYPQRSATRAQVAGREQQGAEDLQGALPAGEVHRGLGSPSIASLQLPARHFRAGGGAEQELGGAGVLQPHCPKDWRQVLQPAEELVMQGLAIRKNDTLQAGALLQCAGQRRQRRVVALFRPGATKLEAAQVAARRDDAGQCRLHRSRCILVKSTQEACVRED
mmetsp:Transcript_170222/g.545897  ORF Transcript_170222/g.545897 Transcript_170222/m.545897 type:complete len:350 (-) Transcript_170222:39-1088(-)